MFKQIQTLVFSSFFCGIIAFAEPGLANRDLWFLPLGGEFQTTTTADYLTRKEVYDEDGSWYKRSSFSLTQGLKYSFFDDWVVGVEGGYKVSRKSDYEDNRNSTSGLVDPSLSVLFRIADQNDWPVFFDANLVISPSVGRSLDNNVLRGSSKVDLEFALGQQLYDWAYKVSAYGSWFSRQVSGSGNSTEVVQSRIDLGLKAALQLDLDPQWTLVGEMGLSLPGRRQYENDDYYEDGNYEFSAYLGPAFQFDRDLSAALKLYTKYERALTHFAKNSEDNSRINSYGVNLALNYNF